MRTKRNDFEDYVRPETIVVNLELESSVLTSSGVETQDPGNGLEADFGEWEIW